MKRIFPVLLVLALLVGCGNSEDAMDQVTTLRSKLLQGIGCEFIAAITADYSDILHTFKMHCSCDGNGNITFEVVSPASISGITGKLGINGGELTFDDHALLFPMLAEGRFSPVSGPWIMLRALRSGFIRGCGESDGSIIVYLDDSYEENALQVVLQANDEAIPESAEVYYHGGRILTILVEDFLFL